MYRNEIEGFTDPHREGMTENICTLCRINSEKILYVEGKPYGEGPFRTLQAAFGMTEGYGSSIRNYDNYVGTVDLNDKERQLGILTHLGVIPAGEGQTEIEPFEPAVKDGKLLGRGTADDKGPIVAAPCVMRAVKKLGIPLNKNIRLVLGMDEGCGSSDIVSCYNKEDEAPMILSPDVGSPAINIKKGCLEGHLYASFQASKAMSRLVKVKAGIKVNVVPGKVRVAVGGIDLKTLGAVVEVVEEEIGISFVLKDGLPVMTVIAQGEDTHASTPQEEKNALIGLLVYLTYLPFVECLQTNTAKSLLKFFPYGNTYGKVVGISTEDELSGALILAFSMLTVSADGLEDVFDSRCPICTTEESALGVVKQAMTDQGLTLENDSMILPHRVDGNSHFVRTLLSAYEDYIGLGGSCQVTGGGAYVHSLKNGVAYDAALPGIGSRMYGVDEFAVADELVLSIKIFAQVIVELCSQ